MPKFYKNYEEAVEAARKSVTHMGRAAVLVVSDGNNFSFCDNDSREIEAAFHFGYEVVSRVDDGDIDSDICGKWAEREKRGEQDG